MGTSQLSGDLMSKDPQLDWVVLVDGRGDPRGTLHVGFKYRKRQIN